MSDNFKKLMQKQIQKRLDEFSQLMDMQVPQHGWIRTIRDALGMSSYVLANKLKLNRSAITQMEQREVKGTITLESLGQIAKALNCKLVYCLVPYESLDKILENQARLIAQKRIKVINHSMKLEDQGLSAQQLQQQEDDLVQELLQGNSKKLWNDDEV